MCVCKSAPAQLSLEFSRDAISWFQNGLSQHEKSVEHKLLDVAISPPPIQRGCAAGAARGNGAPGASSCRLSVSVAINTLLRFYYCSAVSFALQNVDRRTAAAQEALAPDGVLRKLWQAPNNGRIKMDDQIDRQRFTRA